VASKTRQNQLKESTLERTFYFFLSCWYDRAATSTFIPCSSANEARPATILDLFLYLVYGGSSLALIQNCSGNGTGRSHCPVTLLPFFLYFRNSSPSLRHRPSWWWLAQPLSCLPSSIFFSYSLHSYIFFHESVILLWLWSIFFWQFSQVVAS